MKTHLLFISLFIFLTSQAQFSITSGEEDILKSKKEVAKPTDKSDVKVVGSHTVSSGLKTSKSSMKGEIALFDLYLKREATFVTLNLTLEKGDVPDKILVQRKSSSEIDEYSTFKEFTPEEIAILGEDGKIIFDDKYPEPRKLDSYYRIIYEYSSGVQKFTSGVLLPAQIGDETGIYGDHESDESLFIDERAEKQAVGMTILAERIEGKVKLTLTNSNAVQAGQQVSVERKTSDYLATFRSIKVLSKEDIEQLINTGELVINDKYPPSFKLQAEYRVVVKGDNDEVVEYPASELINR